MIHLPPEPRVEKDNGWITPDENDFIDEDFDDIGDDVDAYYEENQDEY